MEKEVRQKSVTFVFYASSFASLEFNKASSKLDLSRIDKTLSYLAREYKMKWISGLTIITNSYYNFQIPHQETIVIDADDFLTMRMKQLKAKILIKLNKRNKTNISLNNVYIFGCYVLKNNLTFKWETKQFGDTFYIKDIPQKLNVLKIYHVVPHPILTKLLQFDDTLKINIFDVNIGNDTLKILLPDNIQRGHYEDVNVGRKAKNSDLHCILFDLINPYLMYYYNHYNDENLPFNFLIGQMQYDETIKMINLPNNNDEAKGCEFTLKFKHNRTNECIWTASQ